jgi:hypothetical protein
MITRYWLMYQPPFGEITWPVMNGASSLARYTAAQAMSRLRRQSMQRGTGAKSLKQRAQIRTPGPTAAAPGDLPGHPADRGDQLGDRVLDVGLAIATASSSTVESNARRVRRASNPTASAAAGHGVVEGHR